MLFALGAWDVEPGGKEGGGRALDYVLFGSTCLSKN